MMESTGDRVLPQVEGRFDDPDLLARVDADSIDRRDRLTADVNRFAMGALLFFIALMTLVWLFFLQPYIQLLLYALALVPVMILTLLRGAFDRRGRLRLWSNLFMLAMNFVVLVVPLVMPEFMIAVATAYTGTVLLGSLFLGNKESRWVVVVSIAGLFFSVLAVEHWAKDWFLPFDETVRLVLEPAVGALTLLAITLLVRGVVSNQERFARQAQLAGYQLEARADAEQRQHERLRTTVERYSAYAVAVGSGDLSQRLDLGENAHSPDDPLLLLGHQLNSMTDNLQTMISQMREVTARVSMAASEILAAVTQQMASTSQQEATVTETMTIVKEVRETVTQTAERAHAVAEASRQSVDISQAGQSSVVDTIAGMAVIQERVEVIAENILSLSERTQQIEEIIATVNGIADQSKLLALNASIEAARAGEEGRGFAVVANEVRQLAEQSRLATSRVAGILNEIQQAANLAVMVTEEGSKGAASGVSLVGRAGEAISDLANTIEEAAQASVQIAASTQQQSSGMDQLSAAMVSIRQASAQAAASTRQAEQSAQDLNDMARQMEETITGYRL